MSLFNYNDDDTNRIISSVMHMLTIPQSQNMFMNAPNDDYTDYADYDIIDDDDKYIYKFNVAGILIFNTFLNKKRRAKRPAYFQAVVYGIE